MEYKRIKNSKDLLVDRHYFCRHKNFENSVWQILEVREIAGETGGRKYIGNRIWAHKDNDQATEKYEIRGPIPIPDSRVGESKVNGRVVVVKDQYSDAMITIHTNLTDKEILTAWSSKKAKYDKPKHLIKTFRRYIQKARIDKFCNRVKSKINAVTLILPY